MMECIWAVGGGAFVHEPPLPLCGDFLIQAVKEADGKTLRGESRAMRSWSGRA